MDINLIKARLNLYAVLQNLEDLLRLDAEMAALAREWNLTIQFTVRNGPAAYVTFSDGRCRHGVGEHSRPTVKLYFTSPDHLNRMFDGKANPIPLKGWTYLSFLKREFSQVTDRMAYYLKPEDARLENEHYLTMNTILTLNTALYAVKELALLDPTCRAIASHIGTATLQVEVLPAGPQLHVCFGKDAITVSKTAVEHPTARMAFRDLRVANALLTNQLDAFLAVAQGDVILEGLLPVIDNVNLILDRVPAYLS